jgi:hypothetical protein
MGMSRRSPFWPTTVSIFVVGQTLYRACVFTGGCFKGSRSDDFFPGQLIGGAPAHGRQHIALLDERAHRAAESGRAQTWTTADVGRATANLGSGFGASAASTTLSKGNRPSAKGWLIESEDHHACGDGFIGNYSS